MSRKAEVFVLQAGYALWEKERNAQRADGTIVLVKSSVNVIVDTGLPKDREVILNGLKKHKLNSSDIKYVVCTHGDADHISNNNLFPKAALIVGFDRYDEDVATFFQKNYSIDENVTVTEMTGHDDRSIGVLVKTNEGLIAITGDLFECEKDYLRVKDWVAFSKRPKDQIKNRARIWELADYIIPGHGDIFRVNKKINLFQEESKQLKSILQTVNVYGDIEL